MVATKQVNPRSFKSIVDAMKSGQYKGRGDLMRAIVDAFRAPYKTHKEVPAGEEPTITGGEVSDN